MNLKWKEMPDWSTLGQQANWSVVKLAQQLKVSVRTLERQFLKTMGKPPKAWLAEQRLKQAMALLQTGVSVKEVAFHLGYRHAHHFSREFKLRWGVRPTYAQFNRSLQKSETTNP